MRRIPIKALVLAGPTAVGKTAVSLEIALPHSEIISADSVQVYRYLNIGSGKAAKEEQKKIPHHLIDIIDPDEQYSAGKYCNDALAACQYLEKNDKLPFFVGGTGLYLDSFFSGIADIPEIDIVVREKIIQTLNERGQEYLYNELKKIDNEFASHIHLNDKQRIIRGLEVYQGTGKKISSYYSENKGYGSGKTLYLALHIDRNILIERINDRVDKMLAQGLVDEVQSLRERGYSSQLSSMRTIGYLQINKYLDGISTLQEAVDEIKVETRRYAKRQMTWFRRNKKYIWFRPENKEKLQETIIDWFESIEK